MRLASGFMDVEPGPFHQRKPPHAPTVLARPVWAQAGLYVAAAVVLGGLGGLVRVLAGWLVGLDWAPMRGPARLLLSIPDPWLTIGLVTVGAVTGLALILVDALEQVSVSVSGERVVLKRADGVEEVPGAQVGSVFRDRDQLVLLGRRGEEIAREKCDLNVRRLAAAFTVHGYTWVDEDPYKDDFRIWVPKTPGLSEHANSLLQARAEAVKTVGGGKAARELRRELARIGVVVRDKDKHQYWRAPADYPTAPGDR